MEASFAEVFEISNESETVFIDIGSGHGKIAVSAVSDFGCQHAIGIEKYRHESTKDIYLTLSIALT